MQLACNYAILLRLSSPSRPPHLAASQAPTLQSPCCYLTLRMAQLEFLVSTRVRHIPNQSQNETGLGGVLSRLANRKFSTALITSYKPSTAPTPTITSKLVR